VQRGRSCACIATARARVNALVRLSARARRHAGCIGCQIAHLPARQAPGPRVDAPGKWQTMVRQPRGRPARRLSGRSRSCDVRTTGDDAPRPEALEIEKTLGGANADGAAALPSELPEFADFRTTCTPQAARRAQDPRRRAPLQHQRRPTTPCARTSTSSSRPRLGQDAVLQPAVLDAILKTRTARLYLFPTKALSQDQLAELYAAIEAMGADIGTSPTTATRRRTRARPSAPGRTSSSPPGHASQGHPAAPHQVVSCSRACATS